MKIQIQKIHTHIKSSCFSLAVNSLGFIKSLLLTLTPIFILGEHGPDNMGRKWVYGRKVFTAVTQP